MSKCFELVASLDGNILVESTSTVEDCTGYVVLDALTHQTEPTLADIFNVPLGDENLQLMFYLGFAGPFLCFFAAWAVQSVIGMFEARK